MRQLTFDAVESSRDFGFKPSTYRELSIDDDHLESGSNVLPILSRLSHRPDERWLTCVNTPALDKKVAKAADIEAARFLRVQPSAKLDTTEVIMKALRSGHSHTVIGFCGDLSVNQREALKQCAELANCQCLVLTRR